MKLENQQIRLRDWEIHDLPIYEKWNLGYHKWMDYNGPYYAKMTAEEVASSMDQLGERIMQNNWPSLRTRLVIADKLTNQLLGAVNWYWVSEETDWMALGIVLYDEKYWGKNLGYEALQLWINYLFNNNEKLVRLDLRTWSGHHGMMKLATKLGFKEEARFRKARVVKGKYYDSIGMGILREEWEQQSK